MEAARDVWERGGGRRYRLRHRATLCHPPPQEGRLAEIENTLYRGRGWGLGGIDSCGGGGGGVGVGGWERG